MRTRVSTFARNASSGCHAKARKLKLLGQFESINQDDIMSTSNFYCVSEVYIRLSPSSFQNDKQNEFYKIPKFSQKEKKLKNVSNQKIIQLVNNYKPKSMLSRKVYERPMPILVSKQVSCFNYLPFNDM